MFKSFSWKMLTFVGVCAIVLVSLVQQDLVSRVQASGISLVQSASVTGSSGNSLALAYPSSNNAGDVLIAVAESDNGGTISLSDSLGNTYTLIKNISWDYGLRTLYVYYVPNSISGSNSVTMKSSITGGGKQLQIFEYSGIGISGVLDQVASSTTIGCSNTCITSPSVNTTQPSELLFAAGGPASNAMPSVGTGYTLLVKTNLGGSSAYIASENQVISTAGSYQASLTFSNQASAGIVLATFVGGASVPDTTPPSVPSNLSATAISSSQINLTWTASTDNVGVTGYEVYRNGSLVGTSLGATYSDTGLSASTAYTYTVAAFDFAGNVSAQSSLVSATTAAPSDTTPPSVPSNLSATAISSSQINLTWTASTDNVGVTGYEVYRNGSLVGTSLGATYSDTGLSASTAYTYTVAAFDFAGNVSAQSSSAVDTTQSSGGDSSGTTPLGTTPVIGVWTDTHSGGYLSSPVGYEKSVWVNSPNLKADCIQTNYLTRGVTSEIQDSLSCYSYASNWTSIVEQGGAPHSANSFPGGHEVSVADYYAPADALILQSDDSYGNSVETMSDLWTWYVGGLTMRDTPFPTASNNKNKLTRFWRAGDQLNDMACDQVNGKCLTFPDFLQSGTTGSGTICNINSSGVFTSCAATSTIGIPPSNTDSGNLRWDSDNHLFYVWGGSGNLTTMTTYDDSTDTWTPLTTTCSGNDCVGTHPPARQCAAMDYSTADHVFLLMGGQDTTHGCSSTVATAFNDTWTFNPTTNAWAEECGPGMTACGYPNPSGAVSFDRLAYDPLDNVFILTTYGTSVAPGDNWVYALSTPLAFGRNTPSYSPTAGSLNRVASGATGTTTEGNTLDVSASSSGSALYIAHSETGLSSDAVSNCRVPTAYINSLGNGNSLNWIQYGTTQDQGCISMRYGEVSQMPMSHVFTANIAGTQWALYEKHNGYGLGAAATGRSYFQQFIGGSWYGGWTPQTPGGTLVAGSNTITLSPMPPGVGVNSQLLINQITTGSSSSEYVQVTAVTPSTVTFIAHYAHTGTWAIAASGLVNCFTKDCSSVTVDPKMRSYPEGLISVGGVPTASFMEENDSIAPHPHDVYVAQYTNGAFSNLGSGPLNVSSTAHATYASAPSTDGAGNIAECWTEEVDAPGTNITLTTTPQLYCKLWNGTSWSQMSAGSLNQNSSDWAYSPVVQFYNGNWYVAYTESSLTGNLLLYVLEYNSSTWSVVGSGPLNINSLTGMAYTPSFTTDGASLYVGWNEQASISAHSLAYVKAWNGISWSQLGGVLNQDPVNGSAEDMNIVIVNGEPTAVWDELTYGNLRQVYSKQWDGTSWSTLSS